MVGAVYAVYTDRFHKLARMVAATKPKTMQKAVQISGALTDESIRNGSIKKVEKQGNMGEPRKDTNGWDDNKRMTTGNAFAMIANPIGRENMGAWLKCTNYNSYHAPEGPCHTPACPRLNRAQGSRENRPNQVVANNKGQGRGNQGNQARGRAFMMVAEEAHKDLNIMTTRGRAFMLGANEARQDPNIVTGIEPSDLGFRYEIEIASGKLVEIDKVIKGCIEPSELDFRYEIEIASRHLVDIDKDIEGCKLEIEGHGNIIHCTAKGIVTHNFLCLKERGIYSIKNFTVHPNKDDFRVVKHATFMLEFDGATAIRKAAVSNIGFRRYPF
nr:hypothetical protein [Tanacetum cinerariifolium]